MMDQLLPASLRAASLLQRAPVRRWLAYPSHGLVVADVVVTPQQFFSVAQLCYLA